MVWLRVLVVSAMMLNWLYASQKDILISADEAVKLIGKEKVMFVTGDDEDIFKTLISVDSVIVLTEKDKKIWEKLHTNVIAINNPLTLKPILEKRSETSKTTRVVSVGRLTEQKGFEYLIESFYLINKNENKFDMNVMR